MSDKDENWKKYKKDGDETKEGFCGACLAIPLAFAGVGASAYGAHSSRGKHKKQKKIALWAGIISIVISILIVVYFLFIAKCKDCVYNGSK